MTEVSVIGVDPSLSGFAFAVGMHRPWSSWVLDYEGRSQSKPCGASAAARVSRYRTLIEPRVEAARQRKPRVICVEGYAFGAVGRGIVDRAELGGILRDRLAPHCEFLLEVAPATLKKFCTGNGGGGRLAVGLAEQERARQLAQRRRDSKAAVMGALSARYGRTFDTDDAADAFGLMLIGLALCGVIECETPEQRHVVQGLREGWGA